MNAIRTLVISISTLMILIMVALIADAIDLTNLGIKHIFFDSMTFFLIIMGLAIMIFPLFSIFYVSIESFFINFGIGLLLIIMTLIIRGFGFYHSLLFIGSLTLIWSMIRIESRGLKSGIKLLTIGIVIIIIGLCNRPKDPLVSTKRQYPVMEYKLESQVVASIPDPETRWGIFVKIYDKIHYPHYKEYEYYFNGTTKQLKQVCPKLKSAIIKDLPEGQEITKMYNLLLHVSKENASRMNSITDPDLMTMTWDDSNGTIVKIVNEEEAKKIWTYKKLQKADLRILTFRPLTNHLQRINTEITDKRAMWNMKILLMPPGFPEGYWINMDESPFTGTEKEAKIELAERIQRFLKRDSYLRPELRYPITDWKMECFFLSKEFYPKDKLKHYANIIPIVL